MRRQRRAQRDHLPDRQRILVRELEVALVVRRHRHHRAGAVVHQHEVGDPYWQRLARNRVQRLQAGVAALLFLRLQLGFRHAAVAAFLEEGGARVLRAGLGASGCSAAIAT